MGCAVVQKVLAQKIFPSHFDQNFLQSRALRKTSVGLFRRDSTEFLNSPALMSRIHDGTAFASFQRRNPLSWFALCGREFELPGGLRFIGGLFVM